MFSALSKQFSEISLNKASTLKLSFEFTSKYISTPYCLIDCNILLEVTFLLPSKVYSIIYLSLKYLRCCKCKHNRSCFIILNFLEPHFTYWEINTTLKIYFLTSFLQRDRKLQEQQNIRPNNSSPCLWSVNWAMTLSIP